MTPVATSAVFANLQTGSQVSKTRQLLVSRVIGQVDLIGFYLNGYGVNQALTLPVY
jgi:hypothetical protein